MKIIKMNYIVVEGILSTFMGINLDPETQSQIGWIIILSSLT